LENVKMFEGTVEEVRGFYTTKSGRKIMLVRIDGMEFVDWKGIVPENLQTGQKVRILYSEWKPSRIQIPKHNTIQKIQIIENTGADVKALLQEVEQVLDKVRAKLQKL